MPTDTPDPARLDDAVLEAMTRLDPRRKFVDDPDWTTDRARALLAEVRRLRRVEAAARQADEAIDKAIWCLASSTWEFQACQRARAAIADALASSLAAGEGTT